MISDLHTIFSENINGMKRSMIRELLKLTQNKEIISFAGGFPSPESFPFEEIKEITMKVLETEPEVAFQYGTTEGDILLRQCLLDMYVKQGFNIKLENLVVVTASQQALDLIAKVFINRGDYIICGLPAYLGALSAFNSYGAQMIGVPLDEEGISAEGLERAIKELQVKKIKPKFIYEVPDFQNPAGICMSLQRRKEVLEIAKKYDILIVEDSPYRELRYEGEQLPTIYSLDNTGHVISLFTFSKTFAPGFRLGWVIAHEDIIDKIVIGKQAADLCTSNFNQRIVARYLESNLFYKNVNNIIKLYRQKRDAMLGALNDYMPTEIKWIKPEGGLFLFVTCPPQINTMLNFTKAIEKKVAYVPGTPFYCDGMGQNRMRLNFSFSSVEQNIEGVIRLSEMFKKELCTDMH